MAFVYLPGEEKDAFETKQAIESEGQKCLTIPWDLTFAGFCREVVEKTVKENGQLDILASDAAYQNRKKEITDITEDE